jgi:hypothetical protein
MRTIYKYELAKGWNEIDLYDHWQYLWCAFQRCKLCVWFQVHSTAPVGRYRFYVAFTGEPLPREARYYLGSAMMEEDGVPIVAHIYREDQQP